MTGWKTSWTIPTKDWPSELPNTTNSGTTINQIYQNEQAIERAKNKVPTHDPYTNPNAYIYFECSCGEVLDPGTKSFTTLIKNASEADWKIRFGQDHYQAYCAKCGVDIE